jgi:hypothetical protein
MTVADRNHTADALNAALHGDEEPCASACTCRVTPLSDWTHDALAAAVSPPPAPTTCPTCRSPEPEYDDGEWAATHHGSCPDSWHQPAPTTCPECGSDDPAEPYVVPYGDDETYCYHPWHRGAT